MSLPRKKSRTITVDDHVYRFMVTKPKGQIHLTIGSDQEKGPVLRVYFEPHRDPLTREAFQVTPEIVVRMIRRAIAKGWEPTVKGGSPMHFPDGMKST